MGESREAVQKALQNPLILQNIFRKLNSQDLLDCRLVNSLNWLDVATKMLREKKKLIIDFNFSSSLASGYFSRAFEDPSKNPWSLKSLVDCIKSSDFFPCFQFRFSQGYLDDQQLLDFFSNYGSSIIELEIELIARTNVNTTIERFGEILLTQLPNLEKLTVWTVALGWSSSSRLFPKETRESAQLPKLKHLSFEKSLSNKFKFLQDIQNAAPNLQKVQEISFSPPKMKKESNLIGGDRLFPDLFFSPEKSNMGFYERILRTKPKFSKVSIDLEKVWKRPEVLSRVTFILTEILRSSQSSLRSLYGVMEITSLYQELQMNLFQFPHVENLTLKTPVKSCPVGEKYDEGNGDDEENCDSHVDLDKKPMCTIFQSFPCLSEINLYSLDLIQNCEDSLQTVKMLNSGAVFSCAGDFEQLAKVFPMLEILELNNVKNFEKCCHSLWKSFSKLTKLQIEIYIESYPVSMDDAFLGTKKVEEEYCPLQKKQRVPSILDLEDLKSLHVTFIPNPQSTQLGHGKWNHWNFLEKSTILLAFEKLAQLKSIHVVVDATRTESPDWIEIREQLPFDCLYTLNILT